MTLLTPAAALGRRDRPDDAMSIFCLLPTLNPYGGVVSVVNAANIWISQGHRVTLGSLSQHPTDLVAPRTEPVYIAEPDHIDAIVGDAYDILLATSWHTVAPITKVAIRGGTTWYYVQDYEPAFYDDPETRSAARATYDMIPNRVVKTAHLATTLEREGWTARTIPPGMNLDIFYPRDVARHDHRVLAMARPPADRESTDHRGYATLCHLFERLSESRPHLDLAVFGSDETLDLPAGVTNHGRVPPHALPSLYCGAAVYVDTSRWHGFGRTGIEAMACGTPLVLTESGGIDEYARHEWNALTVPVDDVDGLVASIDRLMGDPELARTVAANGRATAARYSDDRAAAALLSLFRASLN